MVKIRCEKCGKSFDKDKHYAYGGWNFDLKMWLCFNCDLHYKLRMKRIERIQKEERKEYNDEEENEDFEPFYLE